MIFEKFHDPGPGKKFKKFEILQKFFFLETSKKVLIYVPNTVLGSFSEF